MVRIDMNKIPRDQWGTASNLEISLRELRSYVGSIESALKLREFAERHYADLMMNHIHSELIPLYADWQHIAARDIVLSIYHFKMTIEAVNTFARNSVYIRDNTYFDKIKEGRKLFNDSFKFVEKKRHAVAHAGENYDSDSKIELNSATIGNFRLTIKGGLFGQNYAQTIDGKLLETELTPNILNILSRITSVIYSAFIAIV